MTYRINSIISMRSLFTENY